MYREKLITLASRVKGKTGSTFDIGPTILRRNHSVRRDRKTSIETDSGLLDPNLAMWRSINADHKEVEQVPTDQTENILNYYKDRWIQEHKEKKEVETISGAEVSREADSPDKKSLYSQLARKVNKGQMSSNNPMGLQSNDPTVMQSYDPFKRQKTTPHGPLQDAENKERGLNQANIRQSESVPCFWSSEKSPYNFAPSNAGQIKNQADCDNQRQYGNAMMQQPTVNKLQDTTGPYRPSFNMTEMIGNTAESVKNVSPSTIKQNKSFTGLDAKNEDAKDELNSSSSYKSAPPPVPDFKSS